MNINVMQLNNTSNLLVTLNSSVNFIIYCIFGDKFKRIFLRLFCSPVMKAGGHMDFINRYQAGEQSQGRFGISAGSQMVLGTGEMANGVMPVETAGPGIVGGGGPNGRGGNRTSMRMKSLVQPTLYSASSSSRYPY